MRMCVALAYARNIIRADHARVAHHIIMRSAVHTSSRSINHHACINAVLAARILDSCSSCPAVRTAPGVRGSFRGPARRRARKLQRLAMLGKWEETKAEKNFLGVKTGSSNSSWSTQAPVRSSPDHRCPHFRIGWRRTSFARWSSSLPGLPTASLVRSWVSTDLHKQTTWDVRVCFLSVVCSATVTATSVLHFTLWSLCHRIGFCWLVVFGLSEVPYAAPRVVAILFPCKVLGFSHQVSKLCHRFPVDEVFVLWKWCSFSCSSHTASGQKWHAWLVCQMSISRGGCRLADREDGSRSGLWKQKRLSVCMFWCSAPSWVTPGVVRTRGCSTLGSGTAKSHDSRRHVNF